MRLPCLALWSAFVWQTGLLQLACGADATVAVSFDIAPVPEWVAPIAVTPAARQDVDPGGIAYVLLDRQDSVAPRAFYRHEVRKITSEAGVQNGAAITATFDAAYEKLTFHAITSTRDGVATNRLERAKVQLLRREREMESFIYDGTYTAQCELEDVRVGDVIEFAYTVEGANPVKKGTFAAFYITGWHFPVQRAITRVIAPAERKLHFRALNGAPEPKITTTGGTTEYLCDSQDVPARRIDPDTPVDYDPRSSLEFSEYENWEQLRQWAMSVFASRDPDSPELVAEADKLQQIAEPDQRVVAALRFVQEDIRYLGVESGVGSHQPSPPSEVLRRRFGDCKDKVVLLARLLNRSGIDAAPALVSTSRQRGVRNHLARPEVFDHAILHVRIGDAVHWLDATRSGQRGPLSQVYVSDFGYALVLRDGADALTPVAPPAGSQPRKHITNSYRIPPPGGVAELHIVSQYHGLAAERTRSSFRNNGADETQKEYLKYYARRFPAVRSKQPIVYEELAQENGCRVVETYEIPDIWQLSEDGSKHELFLFPAELDSEMGTPGPSQRNDPLALKHPNSVVEQIKADMFDVWPMTVSPKEITNSFFRFREEVDVAGKRVSFTQSYESRADRVAPADLPKYNRALARARESLTYTMTYHTPEQLAAVQRNGRLNWPIAALFAVVVTGTVVGAGWFYRASKLPEPLPRPLTGTQYEGLGGWLVLVALGLLATPVALSRGFVDLFASVFNTDAWRLLTDPGNTTYHPFWAPSLLFGLFFNAIFLVLCLLVLALFFRRRAAWPRAYITFHVLGLFGVIVDYLLTRQLPIGAAEGTGVREIARAMVAAGLWVPYALVSKRVHSTFRR